MSTSAVPLPAASDPFSPTMLADPYAQFHRVRETNPIYWSQFFGGWVLTRYADVKAALLDQRLSAALSREFQTMQLSDDLRRQLAPANEMLGRWVVFQDNPDHRRLRHVLVTAFTPRIMEQLRQRIQTLADELIDAIQGRGEADLVADFTLPLPLILITELLGASVSDAKLFQHWARAITMYFAIGSIGNAETIAVLNEAVEQMADYLRQIVDDRRRNPRGDLISNLIAEQEAGQLSEIELLSQCMIVLQGGHESTTDTMSSGLFHLLRNPDQYRLLREQPELAASAVEESLRYEPAFTMVTRVATEDLELGGQLIEAGQQVVCAFGAANHDPVQFPDPDRFDITRRPNPHLTFSHGPHFCIGAALARLQGQIAFNTVLRRLPDLKLVSEMPAWRQVWGPRSLETLPVTFTAV